MSLVRRIRGMSRREIAFRVRATLRTQAQRAGVSMFGSRWNRGSVRHVIHPSLLDAAFESAIGRGDWMSVERRLRDLVRQRPCRYVIDPAEREWLREEIGRRFPAIPARAAAGASRLLSNRYDVLGYRGLSFADRSGAIDWHADPAHGRSAPVRFWADVPYLDPACGDHKVIWELNRHQHFLALGRAYWLTGDDRFADRIVQEVESWLAANPPLVGINWSSMLELALRSLSWVAAIHFLTPPATETPERARTPWLLDMCIGLDRQLRHVEENLSQYFSPNTHLTGEALALYVAGTALPELAGSGRWSATGRAILLQEAEAQICSDGGHVERSTHYHRYTLDYYTLAWLTASLAGDRDAAAAFGRAVERLAGAMRAFTDARGWIPLVGDDDGGMLWPITARDPRDVRDSLGLAALLLDRPDLAPWDLPEEAFWLATDRARSRPGLPVDAPAPPAAGITMDLLPETGFVAVRTSGRDHLLFDVGPHGFRNGGHAHADALSITLSLEGTPLLIDPGTATYTMDAGLRDRMRSSRSHNTITLDGRAAAMPAGPFHWRTVANARLDRVRGNAAFSWTQGCHDGYAPATLHRSVVAGGGVWLVIDTVNDDRPHVAEAFWHFEPAWQLDGPGPAQVVATTRDGQLAWLATDCPEITLARGDVESGLGWCSPRYGSLVPTWTARVIQPLVPGGSMVTCIGPGGIAPAVERLDSGAAAAAVQVRIRRQDETLLTVLRAVTAAVSGESVTGEVRTDAALLQLRVAGEREVHLSIADGTYVVPLTEQAPGVWCDRSARDLHVTFRDERVEIWSTAPPGRLRIRAPRRPPAQLLLNGQERPVHHDGEGVVTIAGPDWPAPPSGNEGRFRATTAAESGPDRLRSALCESAAGLAEPEGPAGRRI